MQRYESVFAKLFKRLKRKNTINEETVVSETSIPAQQESTKCPHCENVVELLLSCMEFGDPVVYKCAHCLCSITYPGTILFRDLYNPSRWIVL